MTSLQDLRPTFHQRFPEDHDAQVRAVERQPDLSRVYGIKSKSVFDELNSCHATTSFPSDIAHDVLEGVGKKTLSLVIQHCLDSGHFTIDEMNDQIGNFTFSGRDKVDKPGTLSLNNGKVEVKQTFSQMWCLLRPVPVMVGHLVPANDPGWEALLKLLRAMEYIFAPSLRGRHIRP